MRKRKLLAVILSGVLLFPCFPVQRVWAGEESTLKDMDGWPVDIGWYDEEESEYHLSTTEEFTGWSYLANEVDLTFEGKKIYLDSDIDLNNRRIVSIKDFKGTFEGCNKTLSNIGIVGTGMFESLSGIVQDLQLVNVNLSKDYYHAKSSEIQLPAQNQKSTNIIEGDDLIESGDIGMICGRLSGEIKNCTVENGIITITSRLKLNITDYIGKGISLWDGVGRLVYIVWNIDCNQINVGGICGKVSGGRIENCSVNYFAFRSIDKSQAEGDTFHRKNGYGDLVSYVQYYTSINGSWGTIGGIVGYSEHSSIRRCGSESSSNVTSTNINTSGGICGTAVASNIIQCIVQEPSNDENQLIKSGGLCGSAEQSTVAYCYTKGEHQCSAGIIGNGIDNRVISTYNTLRADSGIVGSGTNELINCFYLSETSTKDNNSGEDKAIAKSAANMKKQDFAERLGYPFVYVEGEYPKLAWELGEEMIMGDVNLDKKLTIADVVELQKELLTETVLNSKAAFFSDLDYNGIINSCDLTLLKRMLIKQ